MMDTANPFAFNAPADTPEWGASLITALSNSFAGIRSDIDKICNKPDERFDEFKNEITNDMTAMKNEVKEAYEIASSAKKAVEAVEERNKVLTSQVFELKVWCTGLSEENKKLTKSSEQQENYSRKDNLIIRGLAEQGDESEAVCVTNVKNFLVDALEMDTQIVTPMLFVRCHRMGDIPLRQNNRVPPPRPIIVRFQHFCDRQLVWGQRFKLAGKSFSINENFARAVEHRRTKLYPILSTAKKSGNYKKKAYLNGDKLRINDVNFTVDDLDKLPNDLDPYKLSYRENKDMIVFGSIHSDSNFLSNYFRLPEGLRYKENSYATIEQAYQHGKAVHFKDYDCANRILYSKDPAESKRLGLSVKNFNKEQWEKIKKKHMLDLLSAKFQPGCDLAIKLMATSEKTLAEAGKSKGFAIGVPLSHPDIFKKNKWTGKNLLGECLMSVRDQLRA